MEMAVKGSRGKLHEFMEWAEDLELYIDPVTSVTEENLGYNSNLYCTLALRTEGEAFDVVKNVAGQNGGGGNSVEGAEVSDNTLSVNA